MRLAAFAVFLCPVTLALSAADMPHGLTVEYRVDPVGMDVARPRLSWKLPDNGQKNVVQVSYRICVSTSAGKPFEPDMWDSGEVKSGQSLNVEYAGKLLELSIFIF